DPVLPATAAAQAAGQINTDHVAVIKKFFDTCPVPLDATTHEEIDSDLARIAAANSPDILRRCAERITFLLNQDGPEPPEDIQARRRGITICPQGLDGTSKIHGYLDAETTAVLTAITAKLGAPGMCNRDDDHPCLAGSPSAEAIAADTRTHAQRTHDAFLAMGRSLLASGKLGQHNGLPVSVVISTTVRELESLSGIATTASGTRLSIPQVIAMAAPARHYLAVFADHKEVPLYLGRSKRLASVGQRLALHARDGGCTKPGCPHPPDRCQGHHADRDYAQGGHTDITDLTLACPKDNRLVSEHGWTTRVRDDGRVEWIPPPLLDTGQDRLNHYWHPEDLFHTRDDGRVEWIPPPLLDTGQDRLNHYWHPEDLFHTTTSTDSDSDVGNVGAWGEADDPPHRNREPEDQRYPDDESDSDMGEAPEDHRDPEDQCCPDDESHSDMDEAPDSDRAPEDRYSPADESYSDMGDATDPVPESDQELETPENSDAESDTDRGETADPATEDDRKLEAPENSEIESDRSVGDATDPGPQAHRNPEIPADKQHCAHPHTTQSPNNRDGPDDP
uniref:HNH endonuclease signature motif containing protein n=1 Tax=Mycolicibacterium brisbanense TaxID=146020 RepID=UPI0021F25758